MSAATLEKPPAKPVPATEKKPLANWKFNLQAMWLNPIVVVEGATSASEARAMLHKMLDQAIKAVERTR